MSERRRTQMKILHTADWHIGQFKGPVVDGVNLRSQDTVKCLEYMVDVAIKERPDIVCISGDIFHQEQIGPVRYSDEMIHATNIIASLARFAGYVIVMRGTPNHDGSGQFRVLKRMLLNVNNVCVVTEPFVIKTKYADIACIPGFDKQEFRAKFMDEIYFGYGFCIESRVRKYTDSHGTLYNPWLQYGIRTDIFLYEF